MIYTSSKEWRDAAQKRILIFGMSGLGKTYLANMLRESGDWFHYSIDYRIGTRYMGEHIVDNFKTIAMQEPFLADLLRTDSIYIASNITFENLSPLSTYLGKPGDVSKGGIDIAEYRKRQSQHHDAEVRSLLDTPVFIEKARRVYGYPHFVCDTGGSICEVVDPNDPNDPVLKCLADNTLMIWLKGSDEHTDELVRRFDKAPKPMCYQAEFLTRAWAEFLAEYEVKPENVDPDMFIRWTYKRAMNHRQPRYAAMAKRGLTIDAKDAAKVKTPHDLQELIADLLDQH